MPAAPLRTLAYADIFDYPLTRPEIHHWSVGPSSSASSINHPHIQSLHPYYFLKGRRSLVALRLRRRRFSQTKLRLARRVGDWLKLFPTIRLVALTGALAMDNADRHDDIDLMIITAPHTLWLTRLIVIPLISLIAKRRKPQTINHEPLAISHANRFCLNLWLDTTALAVPHRARNLYTAHEVAQAKALWDRHDTYHHFLSANSWINRYLPNIKIPPAQPSSLFTFQFSLFTIPPAQPSSLFTFHFSLFTFLNRIAFQFQYLYMKHKITKEKVSLHSAFFHPQDRAGQIMRQYHHRLVKLGLHL